MEFYLTSYCNYGLILPFSWRRSLSCRNQSIDLLYKSMDWFLYDGDLLHERIKVLPLFTNGERLSHFISGFQEKFFESFLTGTKKTWSKVNKCFNTGILINLQSHYLLILVINAADTQFSIVNESGENDWVENVWKFVTLGPSWKIVLKYESVLITESQKESFI